MSKQTKNPKKMAKNAAKQKAEVDKAWDGCKEVALNGNSLEACTTKVTEMEDGIVELQQMAADYSTPMAKFEDGAWGFTTMEETAHIHQLRGRPSLQEISTLIALYRKTLKEMKLRIRLHGLFEKEKNTKFDDSSGGASGGSGLVA
jgi:hypothetical protein